MTAKSAVIEERVGDIFDSPPHGVLIHACNTKGSWGKGVAAAFKKYSPQAFHYQNLYCLKPPPSVDLKSYQRSLVGTCLLIPPIPPPPPKSSAKSTPQPQPTASQQAKRFWIACLFTSHGFGKSVDTPAAILDATRNAVEDLKRQVEAYKAKLGNTKEEAGEEEKEEMGECYSVRINSGLFGVPWEDTKRVLEEGGLDMVILRPPDPETEKNGKAEVKVAGKRKAETPKDGPTSGGKKLRS